MKKLPIRLRRAPVRLDVPGDNWPVFPVLPREGGWRVSGLLWRLFRRRKSPSSRA